MKKFINGFSIFVWAVGRIQSMIETYYRPEMSPPNRMGYSQSPQKPKLFMDWLEYKNLLKYFPIHSQWEPFNTEIFKIAHEPKYVEQFFSGIMPLAKSNGLDWSPEFADSIRYTNASLYYSIENSLNGKICFSPTSGFHHAHPSSGAGFCSMSGQVIASILVWKKFKAVGAYLDIDGHFGNSIEDTRTFAPDLNYAIPIYANLNPEGRSDHYLQDFKKKFQLILKGIKSGLIHYIVVCSGADSLVDDDLGFQLEYSQWKELKKYIYKELAKLDRKSWKFPTTITLFGGYRSDHYESVLDAHTSDLLICLKERFALDVSYESVYRIKGKKE